MGEGAGPGRGKAQHLKAVRERTGMAALAAIFDVVMDRMIVARDRLEGGEIRVGDGTARDIEALADREVLEVAGLRKPVLPVIEGFGHDASGRNSAPSAASPAIRAASRPSPVRISRPCSPIPGAGGMAASISAGTPG